MPTIITYGMKYDSSSICIFIRLVPDVNESTEMWISFHILVNFIIRLKHIDPDLNKTEILNFRSMTARCISHFCYTFYNRDGRDFCADRQNLCVLAEFCADLSNLADFCASFCEDICNILKLLNEILYRFCAEF